MNKIIALSLRDFKHIYRDIILLATILGPVLMAVFMKFAIPFISQLLWTHLSFDLTEYYVFMTGIFILVTPMLLGMLSGFMILDERDEDLLSYYSVTPLTKTGFLLYRLVSCIILTFLLSVFILVFSGLTEIRLMMQIPVVVMLSLEAAMMVLFLAAFANNKVEGLAISKGSGIFMFTPFVVYFIDSKWQLLAGVAPQYWVSKAFLAIYTQGGAYWSSIIIGMIVHLAILIFLTRRFSERIG